MQGIDFWRLADELSVIQAALLICGINPSGLEQSIERQSQKPEGYDAIKHALITSIQSEQLVGREIRHVDPQYEHSYVNVDETLIGVESLKTWLKAKGIQKHFFFFPEEPEGEFLSRNHPRYSPKLAAAVRAWQALEDESLHEKTPKQSVMVWLRKHSAEYDLNNAEGKLKEGTIEEIAKIVNWNPKGGAPSTPYGTEEVKAMAGSNGLSVSLDAFSVLEEKKLDTNMSVIEFDDTEIPF